MFIHTPRRAYILRVRLQLAGGEKLYLSALGDARSLPFNAQIVEQLLPFLQPPLAEVLVPPPNDIVLLLPPLFFFAIVLLRRNSGQKRFGLVKDIGGEVKRRAKRRKTKAAWEAFCEIVTALATRFYGLPRRAKEHRAAFDSEPMLRLPTRSRTSRKHNVWQATKYLGTSHNPSKQGNNDAARLKGQRREGNRGYD